MQFYPSKNNNALNGDPFDPDLVTGYAMVNPHYRVNLAPSTRYAIDSGAFQERDMLARLQPWSALDRQLRLEQQIAYSGGPDTAEAIVTYDMLDGVDEAMTDEGRVKRRGDDMTASRAVFETIRSAHYYHNQRGRIAGAIAYACQGVSTAQYVACAQALIPLIRPGRDWFAFGGFCIVGMVPSLKPLLYAALDAILPLLRASGVHRAHLLGVTVSDAIIEAAALGRRYGVALSTDSSGPERNAAVYGREFVTTGPRPRFVQRYSKADKFVNYRPAAFALEQIARYDRWCQSLATEEIVKYASD
jgi:hypothetical protein